MAAGLSQLSNHQIALIFFAVSASLTTFSFIASALGCYVCSTSLNLMQKSICCNLRGFLLTQNYALDYSEVHGLDEGLSYMFGADSPTIYVPYSNI